MAILCNLKYNVNRLCLSYLFVVTSELFLNETSVLQKKTRRSNYLRLVNYTLQDLDYWLNDLSILILVNNIKRPLLAHF